MATAEGSRAWANVLKATEFAPICAFVTTLGVFSGPPNNNEDCLYLNVFTPNLDPSARLPVIVWIHGGGNIDGETPGYDGSKLAADGKTVVVTIEYRLNLMGFLAHPALDGEGHPFGNYGILDQQAVFKWVARNIAGFGGDKDNVTVGGQSAGAVDTGVHMVSPLAAGLFHRGICQSFCSAFTLPTKGGGRGDRYCVLGGRRLRLRHRVGCRPMLAKSPGGQDRRTRGHGKHAGQVHHWARAL
jgi:para-nitrobenzyl esterase